MRKLLSPEELSEILGIPAKRCTAGITTIPGRPFVKVGRHCRYVEADVQGMARPSGGRAEGRPAGAAPQERGSWGT